MAVLSQDSNVVGTIAVLAALFAVCLGHRALWRETIIVAIRLEEEELLSELGCKLNGPESSQCSHCTVALIVLDPRETNSDCSATPCSERHETMLQSCQCILTKKYCTVLDASRQRDRMREGDKLSRH